MPAAECPERLSHQRAASAHHEAPVIGQSAGCRAAPERQQQFGFAHRILQLGVDARPDIVRRTSAPLERNRARDISRVGHAPPSAPLQQQPAHRVCSGTAQLRVGPVAAMGWLVADLHRPGPDPGPAQLYRMAAPQPLPEANPRLIQQVIVPVILAELLGQDRVECRSDNRDITHIRHRPFHLRRELGGTLGYP